jgi:aryl-alcohol dehydrogenase-like predicted oxidoreductase
MTKTEIRKSAENSLKKLEIDTIDLHYLHNVGPNVFIECPQVGSSGRRFMSCNVHLNAKDLADLNELSTKSRVQVNATRWDLMPPSG